MKSIHLLACVRLTKFFFQQSELKDSYKQIDFKENCIYKVILKDSLFVWRNKSINAALKYLN